MISEDEIGTSEYLRLREETLHRLRRPHDPYRRRQDPGPSPTDQHWTLRRSWTGEEYFVEGTERNEYVTHQYNPTDALRDE